MIGLINRCTRKRNIDIGKIDVMKNFSFFDIESKYAGLVSAGFKGVEFNRKDVVVEISKERKESGRKPYEGKRKSKLKSKQRSDI